MGNVADRLSKIVQLDRFQIDIVEENVPLFWIIVPFNHLYNGALARAGGPDNRGGRASFDLETNALKCVRLGVRRRRISKMNILETDLTVQADCVLL